MTPDEWGPPLWYQMHMKTFNYNPRIDNARDIMDYFENIKEVLPCEKCKRHYSNYLLARPVKFYTTTRDDLIHWLIDLHNEINSRTGKKILSYAEARALYESPSDDGGGVLSLIVVLLLLLLALLCV